MLQQAQKYEPQRNTWIDTSMTITEEPVFELIWSDLGLTPRQYKSRYQEAVKCVIANLSRANRRGICISYSRNDRHYKNVENQPDFYTYRILPTVIDAFNNKGYLKHFIGYKKTSMGRDYFNPSVFHPTESLIEKIQNCKAIFKANGKFIKLKDRATDEFVNFQHTTYTKEAQSVLKKWFELRQNTEVKFGEFVIEPKQPYRIFNENFKGHGRIYGIEEQELKGADRLRLTINGEEVVELDYKSCHLNMCMNMEFFGCSSDLYKIPGNHRELIKKIILTAINAKDSSALCKAVRKSILDDRKKGKEILDPSIKDSEILSLFEGWKAHYPHLVKYVCADKGNELMKIDSDIASDIINFFAEDDILVIPVHDSFIIQKSKQNDLHKAMIRFYNKQLCYEPIIEVK